MDCIAARIMEDQDTWQDARMDEVISYLRYSQKMNPAATDVIELVKKYEERLKQANPSEWLQFASWSPGPFQKWWRFWGGIYIEMRNELDIRMRKWRESDTYKTYGNILQTWYKSDRKVIRKWYKRDTKVIRTWYVIQKWYTNVIRRGCKRATNAKTNAKSSIMDIFYQKKAKSETRTKVIKWQYFRDKVAYFSVHVESWHFSNVFAIACSKFVPLSLSNMEQQLHSSNTFDRGVSYLDKQLESAKIEAQDIDEEIRVTHLQFERYISIWLLLRPWLHYIGLTPQKDALIYKPRSFTLNIYDPVALSWSESVLGSSSTPGPLGETSWKSWPTYHGLAKSQGWVWQGF